MECLYFYGRLQNWQLTRGDVTIKNRHSEFCRNTLNKRNTRDIWSVCICYDALILIRKKKPSTDKNFDCDYRERHIFNRDFISRFGDFHYLFRSLDLTRVNCFLWGLYLGKVWLCYFFICLFILFGRGVLLLVYLMLKSVFFANSSTKELMIIINLYTNSYLLSFV